MTVNRLSLPAKQNAVQEKINEIIDNLGGGGGGSTDVQINGSSITNQGVANIVTNTAYNASSNKIATMSDIPADEIFVATYGTTTYAEVEVAYNDGKIIFVSTSSSDFLNNILTRKTDTEFIFHGLHTESGTSALQLILTANGWTSSWKATGANIDLSNLSVTGEAHFLKNTATGAHSLTIDGTSSTQQYTVNIGSGSKCTNYQAVAIGTNATTSAVNAIAIGNGVTASGGSSISLGGVASAKESYQIGVGTNSTTRSLQFGFTRSDNTTIVEYQLLDGVTGLIPNERISKQTSINSSSTDAQIPSAKSVIELLKTIYPVGSVYLSTNSTCPLASLFGTWSLVSSGKALWTGTGSNGNTTIAAGLPNITGGWSGSKIGNYSSSSNYGAFTISTSSAKNFSEASSSSSKPSSISFNAYNSNTIYSSSVSTVQPPAYVVNVWRRTA